MWKYFFVMLWLLILISTGIHIFSRGFLLSRMALTNINQCKRLTNCLKDDDINCLSKSKATELMTNVNASYLHCLPQKSKIILLVIDALKYDFGLYNLNQNRTLLPYENQLPIINELLTNEPNNARLTKFIADPPTTTLQRLKGLTTGSLPTFIDVGANFATPEINEDNLIDQIVRNNMSAVFMGDSTWVELFPNRFKREYPSPSFNIFDLDTVDTNIMKVLPGEIKRQDWDLLIAHFLGVDHCGHRYGPMHNEMSRKLSEMNEMISMVIKTMNDDTTLFVIGDHGMTVTGDHGGDTDDEINALLFAYTKQSFYKDNTADINLNEMRQIDIVPTIANILGVAIPFSNLGATNYNYLPNITNLYLSARDEFLLYSWQNVLQLRHYFTNYTTTSNNNGVATTFSNDILDEQFMEFLILSHRATTLYTNDAKDNFHNDHKQYLRKVLELCRGVWINFDASQMSHALIMIAIVIIQMFLLIGCMQVIYIERIFTVNRITQIYMGNIVTTIVASFFHSDLGFHNVEHGIVVMMAIFNIGYMTWLCINYWYAIAECLNNLQPFSSLLARIIFIVSVSIFYSNSFIIEEQKILCYLVMSLILLLLYDIQRTNNNIIDTKRCNNIKLLTVFRSNWIKIAALTILVLSSLRLSYKSFRCREEQGNCADFQSWLGNHFDHKDKSISSNAQFGGGGGGGQQEKADIIPVIVLAIFVTFARMYLRFCGSQVGFRPNVIISKYGPIVAAFCIGGHFILSRSQMRGIKAINVDALAWCIYTIFLIHFIVICVRPLMVYVQCDPTVDNESTANKSIPTVFQMLKRKLGNIAGVNGDNNENEEKAYVIGISTVYSSVIIAFAVTLSMLFAILLGPNASNGLFITLIAATAILGLDAVLRYQTFRTLGKRLTYC